MSSTLRTIAVTAAMACLLGYMGHESHDETKVP
jgi:hypothetical protein